MIHYKKTSASKLALHSRLSRERKLDMSISRTDVDVFDVFLSHSHLDAVWVEDLARRLEDDAKLRVWLDKWILIPGEHWQQAMARGLDQAKCCAVCLGDKTPQGWFREEIERALNRQVKDNSFRVIPILLPKAKTVDVDNFLELRTWVDFRKGLQDIQAFHILVSGIRGLAPGRDLKAQGISNAQEKLDRRQLLQLQQQKLKHSVNDEITLEYQRGLIDLLSSIKGTHERYE